MAEVAHFRDILNRPGLIVVPAVHDALTARIAERVGFSAVGMGGFLVAASRRGRPDVGELTMTEMVDHLRGIAGAVSLPVLADADTGYGNPLNVRRTVIEYEAAGAQAIILEDQAWPKKCGHMAGSRQVIPVAEHQKKIEAALDARQDQRTVIIARTDARGPLGFEEAIARARTYRSTGADAVFIEALASAEELREAPRRLPDVPLLANMLTFGKTPIFPNAEIEKMGYKISVWVVDVLLAIARTAVEILEELKARGTTAGVSDRLMGWDDYMELVGLPEYQALERRYGV
jgi:methylisocitrate lyase